MRAVAIILALALAGCGPTQTQLLAGIEQKQKAREAILQKAVADGDVRRRHIANVRDGHAILGMNYMEAFFAWGPPDDVNKTVSRGGTREQCVYGGFRNGAYNKMRFLYFENGVLTTIQN